MGLRVGTIFTRCIPDDSGETSNLDFPCLAGGENKLDECIGIIQYMSPTGKPIGRVVWVQTCQNHRNPTPWLDWVPIDQMWEIGQIS
jgi:hypothetical protein